MFARISPLRVSAITQDEALPRLELLKSCIIRLHLIVRYGNNLQRASPQLRRPRPFLEAKVVPGTVEAPY